jgi:hypothetical protein
MLTLLGSPDDVPQLILSKRYQSESVLPQLNLGLISALTERGQADHLPAALQAARNKADAVAVMHRALPDMTKADGRRKAAAVLQAALPFLRDQYLTIDPSMHTYALRASQWMVDYVQAGMAPQVSDLIDEMAERLVKAINDPSERRANYRTYLEAVAPDILSFATLFLASRLTNPTLEVKAWASRLADEKLQRLFLAVACEALALTGDFDAAVRLAEELSDFGPQPDIGDYYGLRVYAWYPLISFQARSGQPSDAYRLAVDHKVVPTISSIIADYEYGLAERSRR